MRVRDLAQVGMLCDENRVQLKSLHWRRPIGSATEEWSLCLSCG